MRQAKSALGALGVLLLGACVTINIYFPEAAAEKAADKVIDEVWGTQPGQEGRAPGPNSSYDPGTARILLALLELIVPAQQKLRFQPAERTGSPRVDSMRQSSAPATACRPAAAESMPNGR